MRQDRLIRNMEAAAERLTGRAGVMVRFRHTPGSDGLAQKSLDGRPVIELAPALMDERNIKAFAEIFCHEAAHILLHFDTMPRRDIERSAAAAVRRQNVITERRPDSLAARHEDEADRLAAEWMRVVRENYEGYRTATGDPHLAVLQVLYHRVRPAQERTK